MNLKARLDRLEGQADAQEPPRLGPWETRAHVYRPGGGLTVCMRRVPAGSSRRALPVAEPGCGGFDFTTLSEPQMTAIVSRFPAEVRSMTREQLSEILAELEAT